MQKIFASLNQYLLFAILFVIVLYFGKPFLIPLTFAMMLSMLMAPLCRRFDGWHFPRPLSTALCVLILAAVLAGVIMIVRAQVGAFTKDVSLIEQKGQELIQTVQDFVEDKTGLTEDKQREAIQKQTKGAGKTATTIVGKFVAGLSATIATIVLTLVFTFLMIFGKEKYEAFFLRLFDADARPEVQRVLNKITSVSQRYLTGRAMSVTIIWILYSIGLTIVGIKNAIILAAIAAMLTVIPFVGTVLGGMFPFFMALVTEDSMRPALLVIVVIWSIQTMDNYFIEPNVVGGEVNLSALFSILSVLAGGVIWGPAGMILFLPLLGIVKIICDNVPALQPIGLLVGDQHQKKKGNVFSWIKNLFSKRRK